MLADLRQEEGGPIREKKGSREMKTLRQCMVEVRGLVTGEENLVIKGEK